MDFDDLNMVMLEGVVVDVQDEKDVDGKRVMNFIVENSRKGGKQCHKYNCVMWNKSLEKFSYRIKKDAYVRITGHLQDSVKKFPDGGEFHYMKVCADFVESGD